MKSRLVAGLSKTLVGSMNENISYEKFPVAMWVWYYISVWVLVAAMHMKILPWKTKPNKTINTLNLTKLN